MYFPLHNHDMFSILDGLSKPRQMAARLVQLGLSGAAITNHGSVSGVADTIKAFGSVCKCSHDETSHDNTTKECNKRNCNCKGFDKAKLKPILGNEFYLCPKDPTQKDKDNRKLSHLCVLAKNLTGWKSLIRATSESNKPENFYYKPRLNLEKLASFSKGNFICFSGHMGSDLANACFENPKAGYNARSFEEAKSLLWERTKLREQVLGTIGHYQELFGRENFYVEIQLIDAENTPAANVIAQILRKAARETNTKCIGTADSHYPSQEDAPDQRVLLASAFDTTLKEIERRLENEEEVGLSSFFKSNKFHIPSIREMTELHTKEELQNTLNIAEACETYNIFNSPLLPQFECPDGLSPAQYLEKLCQEGWNQKIVPRINGTLVNGEAWSAPNGVEYRNSKLLSEYQERLPKELAVINKANLASYFLIVNDFCNWSRNQGWLLGKGRGSAAGCLVSYLTNITGVDPILYGLIFERFYNEGRNTPGKPASLPDIDVDFPKYKREHVINYIIEKYGKANVSGMANFARYQGRGAIKAVLRAHGSVDFSTMNRITEPIPDEAAISDDLQEMMEESGESSIIMWALENEPEALKEWVQLKPDGTLEGDLAREFAQAMRLEGTYSHMGKHASALVICSQPLDETVPMIYDKNTGSQYIGMEMRAAESLGLVKWDILGTQVLDKSMSCIELMRTGKFSD